MDNFIIDDGLDQEEEVRAHVRTCGRIAPYSSTYGCVGSAYTFHESTVLYEITSE